MLNDTDGNLGAHLRKLEDSGCVDLDKQFENRRPVSWYALSKGGRAALKKHLQALDADQSVFCLRSSAQPQFLCHPNHLLLLLGRQRRRWQARVTAVQTDSMAEDGFHDAEVSPFEVPRQCDHVVGFSLGFFGT